MALPLLSLIVPTFNEAGNVAVLIRKVSRTLAHMPHELMVVDDSSPDGTADVA
jgi:dolichol-phosphate mannosyltransferase